MDTANKLLASCRWIEVLFYTATFKLTAWTHDPCAIPLEKELIIADHEEPIVYSDPMMQRLFGNLPV
jgi:hypothetical protein